MLRIRGKRPVFFIALFIIIAFVVSAILPNGRKGESRVVLVKNGMGMADIAMMLKKNGIISSVPTFVAVSLLTGGRLIAGEYTLKGGMSILDIVRKMERGERNIYIVKIIEGHTIYDAALAFENAGIISKAEFFRLSKDRGLLNRLGIKGDSLEGYLAPDTYYYSKEIEVDGFIEKIVLRTTKFFNREEIREKMKFLGMDIHSILTLASMIEKETALKEEKPLISAVFHNRLKKGMTLDCDPTVIYGAAAFNRVIKRSDLITPTPYNTYAFIGLPKGPICNPDKSSIMAALYPADVDYLYFVSKNDGSHVFSKDLERHNHFVKIYQRNKEPLKTIR